MHYSVGKLDALPTLVPVLKAMGGRHVAYGTLPAHYPLVGNALLATLKAALGPAWTPEVAAAWTAVYGVVADTMMAGAAEYEAKAVKDAQAAAAVPMQ